MRTVYCVLALRESNSVSIPGFPMALKDIQMRWANGMIGAFPVFDKRKDAEVYAANKYLIVEVQLPDKTLH